MCIKSNNRIPYSPLSLNSYCSSGKQTDCRMCTNRGIKKDKRVSMCLIPSCLSMRCLCRWAGERRWQLPYRTASHARQHPLMREKTPLVSWGLIDPNSNTPSQLITLPLFGGEISPNTPVKPHRYLILCYGSGKSYCPFVPFTVSNSGNWLLDFLHCLPSNFLTVFVMKNTKPKLANTAHYF